MKFSRSEIFVYFLIVFEVCVYLADDMIMPAMIKVVNDFQVSESYVPSGLSAFLLGASCLPLFLGPLADEFGKRKFMLIGITTFLFASFFNAYSKNIEFFLLTRFFQGMGAGFISVIGYALVQEKFEEKKAVKITSIMTTIACLVPVMGPFLGSLYISYFSWQSININIGLLSLISLIGIFFFLIEVKKENSQDKKNYFKLLKEIFKNYTVIIKNKRFISGSIAYALIEMPYYLWIAIAPVMLLQKENLSSFEYGSYQAPIFLSYLFGLFLLQSLIEKFSLNFVILFGSFFAIFGLMVNFLLSLFFGDNVFCFIFSFSIYSFGAAVISAPMYRAILFSSEVGLATVAAMKSFILLLISSLGAQSMSIVFESKKNINIGYFVVVLCIFYLYFLRNFLFERKETTRNFLRRQFFVR